MSAKSFSLSKEDLGGKATMSQYESLMSKERPVKFDQHAANYRAAFDGPRCDECIHFFTRHLDGSHVCEVVRPVPEEPILPEFTCQFQTADGKKFPLYSEPK
jgi:hypothetical protein